ncbi:pyridoxal phosphate (PLP)-dependent aspartate aminotransferase [Candidatus Kinetoplastibacterium blastocrithidii TCC012E]|uniref:Pyridoxal phosphate (PLP)-dependent aspartate aminotransferase n=1 Tax=Candidatus Kinetoplastidibacterium blastocrithidiae TCC012E TaxID=1208922 RepID=M1LX72_9PROT|nr:PLP-dependent aminotransferase family protein [Candidatus Kinetoplastibacterium blastocrithidii]AFZ83301.1 aminotransferase [Candidatus Kinetoplastibacterium blastocrithidii (ex Strigomonas culicis)]AGF50117.1 pyridoxal phosphate (PLP)-dependent aspartate aminotransferase [Candidatus Kinetoplastibacterium blastocrithidii TCC012E]
MDKSIEQEFHFSKRSQQLKSSAIREILKVTERAEIISFAGGLPAPSGFPVDVIRAAIDKVLRDNGKVALQYGTTEGFAPLRSWISEEMNKKGANITSDQVLMVSGSQQALDLISKVMVDEGDKILVENPSYLGALQAFSVYQPNYIPVLTDDGGLVPESITSQVAKNARFIYALPNFQNPTGRTLNLERREKLVSIMANLNIPIIEDDPYGELIYEGTPKPSLLSLSSNLGGTIIRLGTFSKVLAPGLRLGYVVAPTSIIRKLIQAKQAADLHTCTLAQMAVYEVVKDGFLDKHLPNVRNIYKTQGSCMLDAIQKEFPAETKWTKPEGGMFLWITLPEYIDSTELLKKALKRDVAFVTGKPFYIAPGYGQNNTIRLSFATVPEEKIRQGISILGQLIKENL